MAKNPPTSFGSYNALTPTSSWSWSTKDQRGPGGAMPTEVAKFYETMFPSLQGQVGATQQAMTQGFAPSVSDYQKAVLNDLAQDAYLKKANFDRMEQARNAYAQGTQAAINRFFDPKTGKYAGENMFDFAAKEQKRLEAETRANQKANEAEMGRARAALSQAERQMFSGYNAALESIGQGQDKIASDMAAAMRQTAEQQRAEGFGGLLGQLEGSEAQVVEAQRLSRAELERGIGANVSQLQFQGAQQRAAIQQAKAQAALALGQAKAGFETAAAQFGAQSRQATEAAIQGSAALAQSHGAFIGQQAQWLAANEMNRNSQLYKMVESNPILGITWSGAFTQLGAISQAAGMGAFSGQRDFNSDFRAATQTLIDKGLLSRNYNPKSPTYGGYTQSLGQEAVMSQMGLRPRLFGIASART